MGKISVTGELTLDGSSWDKTLSNAEKGVEHLADDSLKQLKGAMIEAFAVGAIVEATHAALEFGEAIFSGAARLGISTDSVQELSFAAKQAGSELGTVETGLDRLAKSMTEALGGTKAGDKLLEHFHSLGISTQDLMDKNPEEVFREIGEGLEKITVNAQTTTDMLGIFGRAGGQLIPVLKELREKSEEAHNIGAIITPQGINDLHEAAQGWNALKAAFSGFVARAVAGADELATGKASMAIGAMFRGDNLDQGAANAQIAVMEKALVEQRAAKAAAAAANARTEVQPIGAITDPKQQKAQDEEIAKLNTETARIQEESARKRLSLEERLTEEHKNQKELAEAIAKAKDPLVLADLKNQQAKNDKALQEDQKKSVEEAMKTLKEDHKPLHALAGDSLTKTGNFLGSSPGTMVAIGERTNNLLQSILEVLAHKKPHHGTHGVPHT